MNQTAPPLSLAAFKPPAADAPMVDWALACAAAGFAVFPCDADRKPIGRLAPNGVKDATTNGTQIKTWWRETPYAEPGWAVPALIVVVDLDCKKGKNGIQDFAEHEGVHPDDVVTPQASSPTGGRHLVYEANGAVYKNCVELNGWGIDLRTAGGYIVLPAGGNGREWLKPLTTALAPAPKLIAPTPAKPKPRDDADAQTDSSIAPGDLMDHAKLTAFGMKLLKSGMGNGSAHNFLHKQICDLKDVDEERRQRRLKEIPGIISSAEAKLRQERRPAVDPKPLAEVVKIFREWLALKDEASIYVTLGAVAANLLPGDPVWLGLIAPPSSAKTELLNSLSLLPYVKIVETFTPAGLLSGTSKKDRAKNATGGVLREIGDFGILLFKDFGSLLEMRHEQRADMMAALRRIYDGEYTRIVGSEGGRTMQWRGKAGAVFGATQAYESHHAVNGTLGDRFLLFRVETLADEQLSKCRLQAGDNARLMRASLAKAAAGVFAALPDPLPGRVDMTDDEYSALSAVILEVIRLRAGVVRDGYRREIADVHDPEGPARLSIALRQLFAGLILIGVPRGEASRLVNHVAYDSAPKIRLRVWRTLTADWQTTRQIAVRINLPTTTAKHALEELAAHGLAIEEETAGAQRWVRALYGC